MNISAIDYKENVTIARLQKRYLPKRFVPNYSNCLLQKDISSDAFLLKKSGSDDHLFLRFRKGDSTKENNKEQRRKKEKIVKQKSTSKLPPLLRNQMLTKSMSMQQFYKTPIDIGSTIKLQSNNNSDIIIKKSEIYIKQLLEKRNKDGIEHSKNPKRNEELFKKLPSLIESSLRNSGITSLRLSPLDHLLDSEGLSRKEKIQKLIYNPIIQYKFCEKIVNSITHRIQFLDSKNQDIYEKDVINIINSEIENIIEDKSIAKHHRSFSTQGFEIEPQKYFPPHSLVSNYEEVIKFRNYYKKLLENSNTSSSSSSANRRYISHFLTNENGIQEFLKISSNKETLMEMLLKNEKIKNSTMTSKFFPLSERNKNKQFVTSYQSKFFRSADNTIQHKRKTRNKSGVDMKNCSVQTGEDLYNDELIEEKKKKKYKTIEETEKKTLISLLKSKPTKKELEEFNVIYRKEQKEISETSKTIVKSSDTIHTVHLTSGSNVTNNIQPSKKYKRFESVLNSRKSSTTQLSILKEQKEKNQKEKQEPKVEVKKRNINHRPIIVKNTSSISNDLVTLESTYKTKSVTNIIKPKKQFNSFSESENKIKAKKESSNIEIIKKKEKDIKKDESFTYNQTKEKKKKSISKPKKTKKESSSLPKPKVHNMSDELKKIKKKMKNHKMVLKSKDTKQKEETIKKTIESLHDIGITNTADNKEEAKKEEPNLWAQMVERAKNRKRKINIFGENEEEEEDGPKLIKTLESHLEEKKKFTETLQSNKSEKTDEMITSKRSSVVDNSQIMAALGNKKISKFRRRNAMNGRQLSTYFHQNMRNDTDSSGSNSKRNNIKLKEQLQRKKFFFDLDNTEEVEKRKNMLLLKMSQDITYGITKGDFTEKDKSLFEEFKRKIEELKNFDDKTYVLFLENNFSYFQEELDMLRKIREDEKRINDFIIHMNNDIEVDNLKKKEGSTHVRVIDKKVLIDSSRPFVLASPKILE